MFSTESNGQIHEPGDKGLYIFDTRLISSHRIFANGAPIGLLNAGSITHYAASTYLKNGEILCEDGVVPRAHHWLVCFEAFRPELERAAPRSDGSKGGRRLSITC